MPQRVQSIRSSTKLQRPTAGTREPGELYVNFADLQMGVVNVAKAAQDLIAVRFFSSSTDYVAGDFVINAGTGYKAKGNIPAGAFNASQWDTINVSGTAEPPIAAGTTSQYWRGDKSWQTLDKTAVGLANVDNTSDANKPVSGPTQAALNLKAPLASPTFTGTVIAPTQATGTNNTTVATTEFVARDFAPIMSPQFGGDPRSITPATADNDTSIATTAYVKANLAGYAPLVSPAFSGNPTAPTATAGDNDTTIATTAFVVEALGNKPNDAPSDGNWYGRRNGGWADVTEEAPADGVSYGRKNGAWVASVGGAVISDTAPPGPLTPGQLWWESDSGNTFLWYDDGTSQQWVQQNIQPAGATDEAWSGQFMKWSTVSSPAGLWFTAADLGFGVRGTSFVWNDKADFSGTDQMTLTDTGTLQVGVTAGQTNALIKARTGVSSNALEWGHPNVAGYGSTLGCDQGSGASFIALHGEAGTTNNTHRTRGIRATIIKSDMLGGLLVQNVATASADNQTPVTLATINNAGSMTISSTVATAGATNAALTVAGGIGASRGMWIADNNGYPAFDGQGSMVGLDFAGPGTNYGLTMRNRAAGSAGMILFRNTSSTAGVITCPTITSTTYATTSDIRLKSEVQPATDARSLVDAIEVIEYTPVDPGPALRTIEGTAPADVKWLGISAQQTYSIYPPAVVTPDIDMPTYREGAVYGDEDFMPWMVDHSKLVPMLLANVQELNARNDALEARLAALEGAAA